MSLDRFRILFLDDLRPGLDEDGDILDFLGIKWFGKDSPHTLNQPQLYEIRTVVLTDVFYPEEPAAPRRLLVVWTGERPTDEELQAKERLRS